jgi:hypothetical protein
MGVMKPGITMANLSVLLSPNAERSKYVLPQGVTERNGRFYTQIGENSRVKRCGTFGTVNEAEKAVLLAKIERDNRFIAAAINNLEVMKERISEL